MKYCKKNPQDGGKGPVYPVPNIFDPKYFPQGPFLGGPDRANN